MISKKQLLLIFLSLSVTNLYPTKENQEQELISYYQSQAGEWSSLFLTKLNRNEINLLANILYILYANSFIEQKIRQLIVPITHLNQDIRTSINKYETVTENIKTLQILLDRFSYLSNSRIIYNDTLKACSDHINSINSPALIEAIGYLQQTGQISLNQYAETKNQEVIEHFSLHKALIEKNLPNLGSLANLYSKFDQGEFTTYFQGLETTKDLVALYSLDELLRNNMIGMKNSENISNAIDAGSEYILYLLINNMGMLYKYHYDVLYQHMAQEEFKKSESCLIFGINGLLPEEYRPTLPKSDEVFEHVLNTVKQLYTQAEVS